MKLIIPCNVIIKRFYRTYAEVDENATDEDIRKAMIEEIVKGEKTSIAGVKALCSEEKITHRNINKIGF